MRGIDNKRGDKDAADRQFEKRDCVAHVRFASVLRERIRVRDREIGSAGDGAMAIALIVREMRLLAEPTAGFCPSRK